MARVTVAGWRVERTDEGLAAGAGFGELVVEGEDGVAGAVGAVGGFVFAADDGEGVEDVGGVVAVQAVEVGKRNLLTAGSFLPISENRNQRRDGPDYDNLGQLPLEP